MKASNQLWKEHLAGQLPRQLAEEIDTQGIEVPEEDVAQHFEAFKKSITQKTPQTIRQIRRESHLSIHGGLPFEMPPQT